MLNIKEIDFDTISIIWKNYLWPSRDDINPVSSMTYHQTYDMSIYNNKPFFVGLFLDDVIIGVNSGFKTSNDYYRSRGLYIHPGYRNYGYSKLLLNSIIKKAREEKYKYIWSFPRKESLKPYENVGFIKTSDWIKENVFSGPNCYVLKVL